MMSTLKTNSRLLSQNNLKRAVQGCKLINLRFNMSEIASVAGISERTAQSHREEITEYWSEESTTHNEDKKFILEKIIELGIDKALKSDEPTPDHVFGVILGCHLKVETDMLDKAESLIKVWTIGRYIIKVHNMVCHYKIKDKNQKKGVPIHSDNNTYAKYLLNAKNMNKSNLNKLFNRSDDYVKGKYSKRWLSTKILEKYVEESNNKFLSMISSKVDIIEPVPLPYMLLQKGAIQVTGQTNRESNNNNIYNNTNTGTRKFSFVVNTNYIYTILEAPISIINQFESSSKFSLLTQAIKFTRDEIHIPIKHKAKGSEFLGRTYNVFCSIRSHERQKLGYIGYDMSAAMQSISLQLIKASRDDYPMLWDYANDKVFKKRIRTEIAQSLNIEVNEVKSKLTAFANGSITDRNRHPHYTAFQAESNSLRKEVLRYVNKHEPEVLKNARKQSRKAKDLPEDLDWSDIESQETAKEMRSKSSVFFFVWTWYERKIRQAMLEILHDGIEVHDAVYSKMDIDPKDVERVILDYTGFNIIVEKE